MKKSTIVSFVIASSFLIPSMGFAQTTDNSALIAQLIAQIAQLQAQIDAILAQQGGGQQPWCHTFNTNFGIGYRGYDVHPLDVALRKEGVGNPISFEGQQPSLISDDGQFIERTAAAVVQFQAKYGISQTGYVGPITRAKLNALYGCGGGTSVARPLFNISVTPTSPSVASSPLLRNEWYVFEAAIKHGKPNSRIVLFLQRPDGTFKYGDQVVDGVDQDILAAKVGAITDANGYWSYSAKQQVAAQGQDGIWTAWVTVGGIASDKLFFKVTSSQSSINVLSPNGGESWAKGTTQTIQWQDNAPVPLYMCAGTLPCPSRTYDLRLLRGQPSTCVGTMTECPPLPLPPYTIAYGVSGSSYNWPVGEFFFDGQYKVQVCQSGTSVCDSSDSYFKIVSSGTSVCPLTAQVVSTQSTDNTTWEFNVLVNATNAKTSDGWTTSFQGYSQDVMPYGVIKHFGNFFVSSGPLKFTAQDKVDSNCSTTITVSPPVSPTPLKVKRANPDTSFFTAQPTSAWVDSGTVPDTNNLSTFMVNPGQHTVYANQVPGYTIAGADLCFGVGCSTSAAYSNGVWPLIPTCDSTPRCSITLYVTQGQEAKVVFEYVPNTNLLRVKRVGSDLKTVVDFSTSASFDNSAADTNNPSDFMVSAGPHTVYTNTVPGYAVYAGVCYNSDGCVPSYLTSPFCDQTKCSFPVTVSSNFTKVVFEYLPQGVGVSNNSNSNLASVLISLINALKQMQILQAN